MHIPDGFIDGPTSLAAAGVAVAGLGIGVRKAADALDDRRAPLAGLVAAFVFAVQMLNFPVASGTSGHLLGAVLAAVLVGPWAAVICIAVVLLVQALFADGGLTALGLNIVNMGLIGALGGYAVFLGARWLLPKTKGGVVAASAVAATLHWGGSRWSGESASTCSEAPACPAPTPVSRPGRRWRRRGPGT
ncbi:MAG TPA: energy-coupling factor ABC transporter permease, partial [Acidimicrobiales bacterium]|nr:energy-coupling factor ABC transporter permease [Acidimicrobiales bacterium]